MYTCWFTRSPSLKVHLFIQLTCCILYVWEDTELCSWVKPRGGAELYIFEIAKYYVYMYQLEINHLSIYLINHKCKQAETHGRRRQPRP